MFFVPAGRQGQGLLRGDLGDPHHRLGDDPALVRSSSVTWIWATAMPEIGALDLGYRLQRWVHAGKALGVRAAAGLSKWLLKHASVVRQRCANCPGGAQGPQQGMAQVGD